MAAVQDSSHNPELKTMKMELPKTLKECIEALYKLKLPKYVDAERPPPEIEAIFKYCFRSLTIGRNCGKVVIMMFGQTLSGKSSTFNSIFNDYDQKNDRCRQYKTNGIERTPTIADYELNAGIKSVLTCVDFPGCMYVDVGGKDENVTKIKDDIRRSKDFEVPAKYLAMPGRKNNVLLHEAFEGKNAQLAQAVLTRIGSVEICDTVYPNMILLVVSATDSRLVGSDSHFIQTLNTLRSLNIVDSRHPNLIAVVTRYMSIPPRTSKPRTREVEDIVRSAVREKFQINEVPVVFVENKPTDFDLEQEGDSYVLPNGERCPSNLLNVMVGTLEKNEDTLAAQTCTRYFNNRPKLGTKWYHRMARLLFICCFIVCCFTPCLIAASCFKDCCMRLCETMKVSDSYYCFPKGAQCMNQSGSIAFDKLKAGEKILTTSLYGVQPGKGQVIAESTEVSCYLHYDPHLVAEFHVLHLSNSHKLTITGDHVVFVLSACDHVTPMRARLVKIGDRLLYNEMNEGLTSYPVHVTHISRETLQGVYAPLTSAGTLIVDGVYVSCYSNITQPGPHQHGTSALVVLD